MSFLNINPADTEIKDMHQFIIGAISPRPIALVSTIDEKGSPNLAPYSFFTALSSNPPMLAFSSNLKNDTVKEKDTLVNIKKNNNCVVNIVNYHIVRQMSLCSLAYEHGVSEFKKSGLTPIKSDLIDSFRVKESPVQFECTVHNILALGNEAGASNLIICNILKMHVLKSVMTDNLRRIDPNKLDVMGRLGRSNYIRVNGSNVIEMYQSTVPKCIGYDALPQSIQKSKYLTGNEIAELASLQELPRREEVIKLFRGYNSNNYKIKDWHTLSAVEIKAKNNVKALKLALIPEYCL